MKTARLLSLALTLALAGVSRAAVIGRVGGVTLPLGGAALSIPGAPSLLAPGTVRTGELPVLAPSLIPTALNASAPLVAAPLAAPTAEGLPDGGRDGSLPLAAVAVSPAPYNAGPSAITPNLPGQANPAAQVLESLSGLAQRISAPGGVQAPASLSNRFFDRASAPSQGDIAGNGEGSSSPKMPVGVTRVSVDLVETAQDVDRLIPGGINSDGLIAKLKRNIQKTAPYYIYTYHDALGGSFTGIDLSAKPALVDRIPELQSHEITLIKKIQLRNLDLQVLVREDGKTPDMVVGGLVVELKSLIGREVDFTYLVNKANTQVYEHGRRHGLGPGAAALDLVGQTQVSVAEVLSDLNAWRRTPKAVVLDKIFVFAGSDLKVFVRQADGAYRLDEAGNPFSGGGLVKPNSPASSRSSRR